MVLLSLGFCLELRGFREGAAILIWKIEMAPELGDFYRRFGVMLTYASRVSVQVSMLGCKFEGSDSHT